MKHITKGYLSNLRKIRDIKLHARPAYIVGLEVKFLSTSILCVCGQTRLLLDVVDSKTHL